MSIITHEMAIEIFNKALKDIVDGKPSTNPWIVSLKKDEYPCKHCGKMKYPGWSCYNPGCFITKEDKEPE